MRLLHVSDWHVGLVTGSFPRRPDHEKVFAEVASIVREYRPDLVLHTGDVFHSGFPAVDDMRLGLEALQELAALTRVVVVRGNHDSDRLFRVFTLLLGSSSRLTFIDLPPKLDGDPILRFPADRGATVIALAPLPFVHANRFLGRYDNAAEQTVTFADRLGEYERALGARLVEGLDPASEVAVFAAHQYVQGATKSGSERRLHVSEDYMTRASDIAAVSYAAFGHIHRPQRIPGSVEARYAGSPIQIDFGEENEQKSVVFVDAEPRRTPQLTIIPVSGGRPLRTVSTTLAEIVTMADRYSGALCRVTIHTETPTPNLAQRVQEALPGADLIEVVENCAASRVSPVEERSAVTTEPSPAELFAEFLALRPVRGADANRVRAAFAIVLAAAEAHEEPTFQEFAEDVTL